MNFINSAICILLVVGSALGGPKFPLQTDRDPRIIGGDDAYIEDVPYQVSILWIPQGYMQFCGGSIINHNTILTAAHCVYGDDPADVAIRAGSELWRQGGQVVHVRTIFPHENWDPDTMSKDAAILKLQNNLIFNSKVMPIGLPPKGYSIPGGTELIVSGWGSTVEFGPGSEMLQKLVFPAVSVEECIVQYPFLKPEHICAGATNRSACHGDSGGPVVRRNFVVGIVTGGWRCGAPGIPGIYARVSEILEFIVRGMGM